MRQSLDHAAAVLGVEIADGVAWGWRERSIGAHVTNDRGDWWLRVVRELTAWTGGDFWRGNAEATAITGVPKPAVIWIEEWDDGDVQFRAELMTLIRANRCAATEPLRDTLTLSDTWWSTLRHSVDRVANWPTGRTCLNQETVTRRLLAFCGPAVDATVTAWTTAHGDLHWANVTEPQCYILDWEGWGAAPAGYDAATLYCHPTATVSWSRQSRVVCTRHSSTSSTAKQADSHSCTRLPDCCSASRTATTRTSPDHYTNTSLTYFRVLVGLAVEGISSGCIRLAAD